MVNRKIIDLGWCVARITEQDTYPKLRLEIFSPNSEDANGGFVPAGDITITEDKVVLLANFLENYCTNRQAAKNHDAGGQR